jgi:hypothetical protein
VLAKAGNRVFVDVIEDIQKMIQGTARRTIILPSAMK